MSNAPNHRTHRHRPRTTSPPRRWLVPVGVTVVALAVLLGVAVSGTSSTTSSTAEPVETGEINSMGLPVLETPGAAVGRATAGPIEVTGAEWELGTVPLDTAVRPTWTLHNTGTEAVTVGEPHAQVIEGCCPGPFNIDEPTIPPGGEAQLDFELAMHPGMDGWHDMDVHVPLRSTSGEETLTLSVTGDFR